MGKIPRDLFEDELVPLFEKAGPIWDLRLMMDPLTGLNRGYAFVTFCTKEAAQEAVKLVSFLGFFSFLMKCTLGQKQFPPSPCALMLRVKLLLSDYFIISTKC